MLLESFFWLSLFICFYLRLAFCQEIEIPASKVNELNRQKAHQCCQKHWAEPLRSFRPEVKIQRAVQNRQRHHEQGDDSQQLFGCGCRAGPVPAQAIPPECRCDFHAHASGWVKSSSAPEWHKTAIAAVAGQSFGQSIRFQNPGMAAGTRVRLVEHDHLLVE